MTPEEHNFVGDPGGAVFARSWEPVEIAKWRIRVTAESRENVFIEKNRKSSSFNSIFGDFSQVYVFDLKCSQGVSTIFAKSVPFLPTRSEL